jgi:hypothetical protein
MWRISRAFDTCRCTVSSFGTRISVPCAAYVTERGVTAMAVAGTTVFAPGAVG